MPTMLILRGNKGNYENEQGKKDKRYLVTGAMHERFAIEYARRIGYVGRMATASGDNDAKDRDRSHSSQTIEALSKFREDADIKAFYGFSGGGYNILRIIQALNEDERQRIEWLVVMGTPERDESDYAAKKFKGAHWTVVYRKDPPQSKKLDPDDLSQGHMHGPKTLLDETPDPNAKPGP
jgi:hypothetical protein